MYKNNSRIIVNKKIVSRIKLGSKKKNSSSEIGYYSYTNRCKQKNRELNCQKNFDPLKKTMYDKKA